MKCEEIRLQLSNYVDDSLSANETMSVEKHLAECAECRDVLSFLRSLAGDVSALPRNIPPPRDLWPSIGETILATSKEFSLREGAFRNTNGRTLPDYTRAEHSRLRGRTSASRKTVMVLATIALLATSWFAYLSLVAPQGWNITSIRGATSLGNYVEEGTATLRRGQWLETYAHALARINVGTIGEIDVEQHSRLKLLDVAPNDHRVQLERGTIHARIWAPPRLFFVETPSATAIDLGCAYTLTVDDSGGSLLKVRAGVVALEYNNRESLVPAGSACETRPDIGPGTPFRLSATLPFRSALAVFDLAQEPRSLADVLQSARPEDAVTLWHLLRRTEGAEREQVFDRLVSLATLPKGVTREGILMQDKRMLHIWGEEMGLVF